MLQKFNSIGHISGELTLPGDKSVSHRAIIFFNPEIIKSSVQAFRPEEETVISDNLSGRTTKKSIVALIY